ncbi:putative peptidoglycan lipid II flippase [Kutzneria buriramensis]|uniref:Putative peptidoglycan lipid II flippase n=2 Tax=Kutzneria buriramensis TaxID=1045776 RepID=A0A3E0GX56_9PSEU|nr:putative peptidoglycan lipid II flippase [Kutzneria buriramensis]
MAVATLVSRITGFVSKLLLAAVVGFSAKAINDSYTVANTVPNIIYELLLGGVLTSVVVPLLVRARHEDPDGGEEYTHRLLTVSFTMLIGMTALAVAAAPLLTKLFVDDASGNSNPALVTAFAYLLLPEILFYGMFAMVGAILNTRNIFSPPAWAPVLNNVTLLITIGAYFVLPGDISTDPVRITDFKLLLLGLGTTLGIVIQAVVLLPPLLRTGYRPRWKWGWDKRLSEFGGLALWVVAYVVVSQVGYITITRVGTNAATGSISVYTYSWLLVQMPYGVLGVSLLTAIMPRMSKAAATKNIPALLDDLSLGSRMSAVMLAPISALMTVLGPALAVGITVFGKGGSDATRLGLAITASSFGLLPYALTMLQMRVFYAMKDARTPTVINAVMIALKVPVCLLAASILPPSQVVFGLTFSDAISFSLGMLVGELLLRKRFGRLGSRRVVRTYVKVGVAAVWGAAVALVIELGVRKFVPGGVHGAAGAWLSLVGGGVLGLLAAFGMMALLRVHELRPALDKIASFVRR